MRYFVHGTGTPVRVLLDEDGDMDRAWALTRDGFEPADTVIMDLLFGQSCREVSEDEFREACARFARRLAVERPKGTA